MEISFGEAVLDFKQGGYDVARIELSDADFVRREPDVEAKAATEGLTPPQAAPIASSSVDVPSRDTHPDARIQVSTEAAGEGSMPLTAVPTVEGDHDYAAEADAYRAKFFGKRKLAREPDYELIQWERDLEDAEYFKELGDIPEGNYTHSRPTTTSRNIKWRYENVRTVNGEVVGDLAEIFEVGTDHIQVLDRVILSSEFDEADAQEGSIPLGSAPEEHEAEDDVEFVGDIECVGAFVEALSQDEAEEELDNVLWTWTRTIMTSNLIESNARIEQVDKNNFDINKFGDVERIMGVIYSGFDVDYNFRCDLVDADRPNNLETNEFWSQPFTQVGQQQISRRQWFAGKTELRVSKSCQYGSSCPCGATWDSTVAWSSAMQNLVWQKFGGEWEVEEWWVLERVSSPYRKLYRTRDKKYQLNLCRVWPIAIYFLMYPEVESIGLDRRWCPVDYVQKADEEGLTPPLSVPVERSPEEEAKLEAKRKRNAKSKARAKERNPDKFKASKRAQHQRANHRARCTRCKTFVGQAVSVETSRVSKLSIHPLCKLRASYCSGNRKRAVNKRKLAEKRRKHHVKRRAAISKKKESDRAAWIKHLAGFEEATALEQIRIGACVPEAGIDGSYTGPEFAQIAVNLVHAAYFWVRVSWCSYNSLFIDEVLRAPTGEADVMCVANFSNLYNCRPILNARPARDLSEIAQFTKPVAPQVIVGGPGTCWRKLWRKPYTKGLEDDHEDMTLQGFVGKIIQHDVFFPEELLLIDMQTQCDGDWHLEDAIVSEVPIEGKINAKDWVLSLDPGLERWWDFDAAMSLFGNLDALSSPIFYKAPKGLRKSWESLQKVLVGNVPDMVATSSQVYGAEIARGEAVASFNAELASMPCVPFAMPDDQLKAFSEYVGTAVRSTYRRHSWNDHLFLEASRALARKDLFDRFPHNTDIQTVLHVGSTTQEVKQWWSHLGHDFNFAMKDSKDTARVFEDVSKLLAIKINDAAPPSLATMRKSAVRLQFDDLNEVLNTLTADGRKRFVAYNPLSKTNEKRKYNVLMFEDSLYDVPEDQFADMWRTTLAKIGYAIMFFPNQMLDPDCEPSKHYVYEEYFDPAVTVEILLERCWPSILLFSPLIPLKDGAKLISDILRSLGTAGWDAFKEWVTRIANDDFPLLLMGFSLIDFCKVLPIVKQIFRNLKPIFRKYCMRAKVHWRGGVSNGYDHALRTWEAYLKTPRFAVDDFFIDSEIVGRFGEMYLMRFWRSDGTSPIVRSLQLPISMSYVRVADLEESWSRVDKTFRQPFVYKSFKAETWFRMLNWCMAEPTNSLDFGVIMNAINRVSKGLSVGSNVIAPKAPHEERENSILAIALLMETFKRRNILADIESDKDLQDGYKTNFAHIAEIVAKTGIAVFTGGLGIFAWFIYKYLITENAVYDYVQYPMPIKEIRINASSRKGGQQLNQGAIEFVIPPISAKGSVDCYLCEFWRNGLYSSNRTMEDGQQFHLSGHDCDNVHEVGFDDREVLTLLDKIRDSRTYHEGVGAHKLSQMIKKFEDWVDAQSTGWKHKARVSHIKGGPGTGKTEIIKVVLHALGKLGVSAAVTMPFKELSKDFINASVLGVAGTHNFASDTTWWTLQRTNTRVLIVDECTGVDWSLARAIACYIGAAEIILVGDRDQTHLRPETGEGIDPTHPDSGLDWTRVPVHELVYNYRLGAWRTKLLNLLYGYRMISKRQDNDTIEFVTRAAFVELAKQTKIDREMVFTHAAATECFGAESSPDRSSGVANLSVRSSQGMTVDYAAVGVSQLDNAVVEVQGMLCVAISRAKYKTYFVTPENIDDPVISRVREFLHSDSQARIDAVGALPWPRLPDPTPKVNARPEDARLDALMAQKKQLGKLKVENALNEEDKFINAPAPISGTKVDIENPVAVLPTMTERVDMWQQIFHTCIFDAVKKDPRVEHSEVDKVFVAVCESMYFHDYAMGRCSLAEWNARIEAYRESTLVPLDAKDRDGLNLRGWAIRLEKSTVTTMSGPIEVEITRYNLPLHICLRYLYRQLQLPIVCLSLAQEPKQLTQWRTATVNGKDCWLSPDLQKGTCKAERVILLRHTNNHVVKPANIPKVQYLIKQVRNPAPIGYDEVVLGFWIGSFPFENGRFEANVDYTSGVKGYVGTLVESLMKPKLPLLLNDPARGGVLFTEEAMDAVDDKGRAIYRTDLAEALEDHDFILAPTPAHALDRVLDKIAEQLAEIRRQKRKIGKCCEPVYRFFMAPRFDQAQLLRKVQRLIEQDQNVYQPGIVGWGERNTRYQKWLQNAVYVAYTPKDDVVGKLNRITGTTWFAPGPAAQAAGRNLALGAMVDPDCPDVTLYGELCAPPDGLTDDQRAALGERYHLGANVFFMLWPKLDTMDPRDAPFVTAAHVGIEEWTDVVDEDVEMAGVAIDYDVDEHGEVKWKKKCSESIDKIDQLAAEEGVKPLYAVPHDNPVTVQERLENRRAEKGIYKEMELGCAFYDDDMKPHYYQKLESEKGSIPSHSVAGREVGVAQEENEGMFVNGRVEIDDDSGIVEPLSNVSKSATASVFPNCIGFVDQKSEKEKGLIPSRSATGKTDFKSGIDDVWLNDHCKVFDDDDVLAGAEDSGVVGSRADVAKGQVPSRSVPAFAKQHPVFSPLVEGKREIIVVVGSPYVGKSTVAGKNPFVLDLDKVARVDELHHIVPGLGLAEDASWEEFNRVVKSRLRERLRTLPARRHVLLVGAAFWAETLGLTISGTFHRSSMTGVPIDERNAARDKWYSRFRQIHHNSKAVTPEQFQMAVLGLVKAQKGMIVRHDHLEKSTFKYEPPVDFTDPHRRLASEYLDTIGVYGVERRTAPDKLPGKNWNKTNGGGKDTYRLSEFVAPARYDNPAMINEAGPVQGMMRPNNAQIDWGKSWFKRTRAGAISHAPDRVMWAISAGHANHFGTSNVETLNAAERIGQLKSKPRLSGEATAWAERTAINCFRACWKSDPIGKEEYNEAVRAGWADAKRRNYGGRMDAEYRRTMGRPTLYCNNKDQRKPVKNGKLNLLKTGQLIVQSPPDVNLRFMALMRYRSMLMKDNAQEHFYMDDYEDPDSFNDRLTQGIRSLPSSSRFGVMDFVEFDSQQNEVTIHMEKVLCRLSGIPQDWIEDYYAYRGKGLSVVFPGLFKARMNQEKPSGFLDTKSGNTALSTCLAVALFKGSGPKVHAAKGDDTLVVQANLEEDKVESIKIRKYTGMRWLSEINYRGGEFIGCSVGREGMFRSITRTANKAISNPCRDYAHFCEQQTAWRDIIASWNKSGKEESIVFSAKAENCDENYVRLCYDFVVSMSKINEKQWSEVYRPKKYPKFQLRGAEGPTMI
uniref:Polyprotein n=1 Tax=Rhizoctonia beny-like virus 1 TaxID=3074475 RepID=A0AA51VIK5_9VIRU|nr:polyprotein [Rhizoctonia beny-like virus 1]